jgi:hypothetical protein
VEVAGGSRKPETVESGVEPTEVDDLDEKVVAANVAKQVAAEVLLKSKKVAQDKAHLIAVAIAAGKKLAAQVVAAAKKVADLARAKIIADLKGAVPFGGLELAKSAAAEAEKRVGAELDAKMEEAKAMVDKTMRAAEEQGDRVAFELEEAKAKDEETARKLMRDVERHARKAAKGNHTQAMASGALNMLRGF